MAKASADSDSTMVDASLDDAFCPECNYSLRGLLSDYCPECGFDLESLRSRVSEIPWVHRKEIGFFRAYWRTVWMVLFRHRRFRSEIARPVSYCDAQRFRFVTILHAYIPLLLIVPTWSVLQPTGFEGVFKDFGITWIVLEHLAAVTVLIAITGLPSYFFHPRYLSVERQNRAVAMSYYGCAALAFLPMGVIPFWLGMLEWRFGLDAILMHFGMLGWESTLRPLLLGSGTLVLLLSVFYLWFEPVRLVRALLRRTRDVVLLAVGLPVLFVLAAALILVAFPASILYVVLLFRSL